jgi:hypothetical protein
LGGITFPLLIRGIDQLKKGEGNEWGEEIKEEKIKPIVNPQGGSLACPFNQ